MDHDAMHKDVAKLKGFRDRVEKVIPYVEGLMAAGGKVPGTAGMGLSDDERGRIIDSIVLALGGRLSAIEGRIDSLEKAAPPAIPDMSSFDQRLNKLETAAAPVAAGALDPELSGRLEAMLTWFDANKDGLELLLSLDGDPDQIDGTSNDAGTAAGAAGDVAGAGSAPAAPADAPAPAASQDASTDAVADPAKPASQA